MPHGYYKFGQLHRFVVAKIFDLGLLYFDETFSSAFCGEW
jgi:hypothetical protein